MDEFVQDMVHFPDAEELSEWLQYGHLLLRGRDRVERREGLR
jgi:hypothetical protein